MDRRQFLKVMGGGIGATLLGQGLPGIAFGQKKRMSLATGPVGGVYYPLGGGMANVISKYVGGLEVTSELTQGSVDNCRLIHMGKAELAMVMADIAFDAYSAAGRFKDLPKGGIQTLFVIYNNYLHTVAAEGKGIKTFFDLKGKRLSTGSPGSGSEVISMRLLEAHGINPEKDIKRERLGPGEASGALKDGKIDAFFWMAGIPMPIVMDLVHTPGMHIRLLAHDKGIPNMRQKYGPYYFQLIIPKGSYKGIDYEVPVLCVSNLLICNPNLDEKDAHSIVKVIMENKKELVVVHKEAENISLQSAVVGSPIPFHPGAIKYYQEKGIKILTSSGVSVDP
ncbi:MAG: TAXI family TRAP transporter solute-binding subunit [Deltaproteobacteria bacterium]|nr:TAXI family TRAP transporter solute-binding subunit [Deltaproteobacteria bacterium]